VLATLCFSARSVRSIIGAMAKTLSNLPFLFIFLRLESSDRRGSALIAYSVLTRHFRMPPRCMRQSRKSTVRMTSAGSLRCSENALSRRNVVLRYLVRANLPPIAYLYSVNAKVAALDEFKKALLLTGNSLLGVVTIKSEARAYGMPKIEYRRALQTATSAALSKRNTDMKHRPSGFSTHDSSAT
jgi:hypothetical protein